MSKQPLPQPVLKRPQITVDENHGLWGFFNKKRTLFSAPHGRGRPWTVEELRHKSWEDLHSLWYKCCIERNRIATEIKERKRLQLEVQEYQPQSDDLAIRKTQAKIKHTLSERWYAWQEAWKVAENDPEVNLKADLDTPAYQPRSFEDEEEVDEQPRIAAEAA